MKRAVMSTLAVCALVLALSPGSSAAGRHPQIEAALESLRTARMHLQEAKHDFKGHRVNAIKAIDEAIHQTEICMQYD